MEKGGWIAIIPILLCILFLFFTGCASTGVKNNSPDTPESSEKPVELEKSVDMLSLKELPKDCQAIIIWLDLKLVYSFYIADAETMEKNAL